MKKKEIWDYISIGTDLRYLQDLTVDHPVIFEHGPRDNLRRLLAAFKSLGLNVTLRASIGLVSFLDKLDEIKEDRNFSKEEIKELTEELKYVRRTMSAECQGIFAYITSDKRYDVTKLSNSMEQLFTPEAFNNLPDMAQYDFSEAGKCIVFERPTAAAFHILRGTEVLVRIYYKKYLRKKPEGKTWGQLLNELKNKTKGKKPNSITVNHLINIKDSFRNPTQHPDKVYDIQEVQDLLSVCIDVVNKMVEEIK